MNSTIGGPGWDRTNDQPIMSSLSLTAFTVPFLGR